jgi:hypothetical protein
MRHQHVQTRAVADDAETRANGASSSGTGIGEVQRVPIVVSLAQLQGETSGTPFTIYSASSPGPGLARRVLGAELDVTQEFAAPGLSNAHVEVGPSGTVDGIIGSTDVFGFGPGFITTPGSNPVQTQALGVVDMTVTLAGAAMAALTGGAITVNLYIAVTP